MAIVKEGDNNHKSDEYCDECDIAIPTDGVFKKFTCPECGGQVTPCNVCPLVCDPASCDKCLLS